MMYCMILPYNIKVFVFCISFDMMYCMILPYNINVCIVSKGLTSAVLNTSKMFEEIGDLYAKQVTLLSYANSWLHCSLCSIHVYST